MHPSYYQEDDTTGVLSAFNEGKIAALNQLFSLYYGSLCLFGERLTNDNAEAREIAADAFIKLWERRGNFQSLAGIKSFLFITTRNASINFLKKEKRKTEFQRELLYRLENKNDFVVEEEMEAEIIQAIYMEIENLPDKCRMIFKMIFLQGLSTRHIAEKLNLSINTVQAQKQRAIASLRTTFLKKYGDSALATFLLFLL